MATTRSLTAVIEREGDWYVALCPELDVASQGTTVEESQRNLLEAVTLFVQEASPSEVRDRLSEDSPSPQSSPVKGEEAVPFPFGGRLGRGLLEDKPK
jgi:predicted RNase H-like HicB family nuclease